MSFDSAEYPYRSVVQIQAQLPDGSSIQGSGVMVAPDEVLTAAHMVWEQGVGTATGVEVIPGYNQGAEPFGSVSATDWHFLAVNDANGTETQDQSANDIALVHLSQPIGNEVGWMGIQTNFAGGSDVHITGYPASLGGTTYNGQVMVDSIARPTLDQQLSLMDFPAGTTNHGDSGGPIWEIGRDGSPYVLGVVSAGGSQGDLGPIITTSLFNDIKQWEAVDHPMVA
jgi:V8-like Glu-specific endopeptidase